jgi:hypothetical protein
MIPVPYVCDASHEKATHMLHGNDTSVDTEVCLCGKFSLEAQFCKLHARLLVKCAFGR